MALPILTNLLTALAHDPRVLVTTGPLANDADRQRVVTPDEARELVAAGQAALIVAVADKPALAALGAVFVHATDAHTNEVVWILQPGCFTT